MTLHEYARKAVAALRRGWVWLKAQWTTWRGKSSWPSEPVDDTHANYRRQYEQTIPLLRHLPRGIHHPKAFERRNTILYLAEILDGLHNFGDDPIMPPYARRAMREEVGKSLWKPAPAHPQGFAALTGALGGNLVLILGAVAVTLSGFAWGALERAGKVEAQSAATAARRDPCEPDDERKPCVDLRDSQALNADLAANIAQAAEGAQQAAQTIEAERARANAARRRERDLINEIQSRTRDVGAPPAWSLRDSEGGDPAGPGAGASGDPG